MKNLINFPFIPFGRPIKFLFYFLVFILVIAKIYNSIEVILLVEKVSKLVISVTKIEFQLLNLSYFSELYRTLTDINPRFLKNHKIFDVLLTISKKIPHIFLTVFFLLIAICYILLSDFEILYYSKIGLHHLLIHKIVHILETECNSRWYKSICIINKLKRWVKVKYAKF